MLRKISALIITITFFGQVPIWASNYSNPKAAREAAVKAMKDFQSARDACMDITAPKNKLTATEVVGIKIILEHAKTLLDDCLAQDSLAEMPIEDLNSDTGNTPMKSIADYEEYVLNFGAFIDTLKATSEDIQEAVPAFAALCGVIGAHYNDLYKFDERVKKFESTYSDEIKNEMSLLPAWKQYQDLITRYSVEKEKYANALLIVDEFEWVKDLTVASNDVVTAIGNILLYDELDKVLNVLADSQKSKTENSKSDMTATQKKKITITCIKGKVIKKVSAVNPKCPSSYKKK